MINNPEQTTDEEILVISKTFGIPVYKINAILQKNDIARTVKKQKKGNLLKEEVNSSSSLTMQPDFSDFTDDYINALNQAEEVDAIRKYVSACILSNQAKALYELCPVNQTELQQEIIFQWVKVSENMADLSEVKPLTNKGTPAGDLAYRKYIKFF